MSDAGVVGSTIAGALLILVTLRDMFHELFHPEASGSIGRTVRRKFWALCRRTAGYRRTILVLAGPALLVGTVIAWTAALVIGWALVYWPHLGADFRFASPLAAPAEQGFGTALYVSFVTLVTLGYGDISPTGVALRVLTPFEAMLGFAVLTAGISWILSLYPVLSRRRALSQQLADLHQLAHEGSDPLDLEPVVASRILSELSTALTNVRAELTQTSISYYFIDEDDALALPAWLPYAHRLAQAGAESGRAPAVRHAAAMLGRSVDGYLEVVRKAHLGSPPQRTRATMEDYRRDHRRDRGAGAEC